MTYAKFIVYNVVGGILVSVAVCLSAGYFFGNLTFVMQNVTVVILAHHLHLHPARVYEFVRHKMNVRTSSS